MKQTKLPSFGEQCYNYGKQIDVMVIDIVSIEKLKEEKENGQGNQ